MLLMNAQCVSTNLVRLSLVRGLACPLQFSFQGADFRRADNKKEDALNRGKKNRQRTWNAFYSGRPSSGAAG